MIKKCCENCVHKEYLRLYGIEYLCCESLYEKEDLSKCCDFRPTEEIVRQDERKNITNLILNSNFYIKDNDKVYEVLVNEVKPKTIDTFEESIRENERNKIITLLKSDLENYNGLAIEKADNNHCRVWIKYNEVRKYIKSTIELLEKN